LNKKIEAFKLIVETAEGFVTTYHQTFPSAYEYLVRNVAVLVGDYVIERA